MPETFVRALVSTRLRQMTTSFLETILEFLPPAKHKAAAFLQRSMLDTQLLDLRYDIPRALPGQEA
jgi:hypothetical protein